MSSPSDRRRSPRTVARALGGALLRYALVPAAITLAAAYAVCRAVGFDYGTAVFSLVVAATLLFVLSAGGLGRRAGAATPENALRPGGADPDGEGAAPSLPPSAAALFYAVGVFVLGAAVLVALAV